MATSPQRTTINPKLTLGQRVRQFFGGFRKPIKQRVAEIIGQWTLVRPLWTGRILISKDTSWPDYVFWDSLRRGKAPGLEIGGLFCSPIAQTIASYAFGTGISMTLVASAVDNSAVHENGKPTQAVKTANTIPPAKPTSVTGSPIDFTNMQIRRMVENNQGFFLNTVVDAYCLGEQYVFVNPDCTFSIASPETVNVEYSASDYRQILKVTVSTKYISSIVQDIYTADERTVIIKYYDGRPPVVEHYANLIGRIPMVHFATDRGPNEVHGRPIYEAALPIMRRYDDLLYKTCDGVDLIGNPIPAFTGLDNPRETLDLNSTQQTYTDEDGNTQTRNLLRFDRNLGLVLGKGGDVKMVAPPVGFTKDSLDTLRQLFLLLLNHVRVPEFIWGGAIQASKASTQSQMPPFITYIKYRRLLLEGIGADEALGIEARGGLLELVDLWLRTYQLLNPAIVVGPVQIKWPTIDAGDTQSKFMWGQLFGTLNKITDEDLVDLSGYFDDPAAVVARAQGMPQRPSTYDDYDARLKLARLKAAQASTEPADNAGEGWSTDYSVPNPLVVGDGIVNYDGVADKRVVTTNPYSLVGAQVWQGEVGTN